MPNSKNDRVEVSRAEINQMIIDRKLRERVPHASELPRLAPKLKKLADDVPVFLTPEPIEGAKRRDCWLNVKRFLESGSIGEPCSGWHIICQPQLYYLKCIPHVVIKVGDRLFDVTPPEGESQVLFLKDQTVTIETRGKIIGLSTKNKARRVIAAAARIAAFAEEHFRKHNDNPENEYATYSIEDLPYGPRLLKD